MQNRDNNPLIQKLRSSDAIELSAEQKKSNFTVIQIFDALKKESPEKEDWEELLKCPVSMELFHQPTLLNCGHTFSQNSVASVAICPSCRGEIKTRTENTVIKEFIDELAKTNSKFLSDDDYMAYITNLVKEKNPKDALVLYQDRFGKEDNLLGKLLKDNQIDAAVAFFSILDAKEKMRTLDLLTHEKNHETFCKALLLEIVKENQNESTELILKLIKMLSDKNLNLTPENNNNPYTIINYAIDKGNSELLKELLNLKNISVNINHLFTLVRSNPNDENQGLLILAISKAREDPNFNIDAKMNGKTLLQEAIKANSSNMIKVLLEQGSGSKFSANDFIGMLNAPNINGEIAALFIEKILNLPKGPYYLQNFLRSNPKNLEQNKFLECYKTCLDYYYNPSDTKKIDGFVKISSTELKKVLNLIELHLKNDNANKQLKENIKVLSTLVNEFGKDNNNIEAKIEWPLKEMEWQKKFQILNLLFEYLSSNKNIKENLSLRKNIRTNAFNLFTAYLDTAPINTEEKLHLLNVAKKSPIFSGHRDTLTFGRTATVKAIDKRIKLESENLKYKAKNLS